MVRPAARPVLSSQAPRNKSRLSRHLSLLIATISGLFCYRRSDLDSLSPQYNSTTMFTKYLCSTVFLVLTLTPGAASAKQTQVYFGTDRGSEGIYSAQFESATGTLSSITLAVAVEFPGFLATHPNQQFLYCHLRRIRKTKYGRSRRISNPSRWQPNFSQ